MEAVLFEHVKNTSEIVVFDISLEDSHRYYEIDMLDSCINV